jgi:hypothetical protein
VVLVELNTTVLIYFLAPGSLFNYSSGTTNIIVDILTCALCPDGGPGQSARRTGDERKAAFMEFFQSFAGPTGMNCTYAAPKFDRAGTFVGSSWLYSSVCTVRYGPRASSCTCTQAPVSCLLSHLCTLFTHLLFSQARDFARLGLLYLADGLVLHARYSPYSTQL